METPEDTITVTVGIFSGRPNPELLLTGPDGETFANLASMTIGKEPVHPPPPPRLGHYYGFLIQMPRKLAERLGVPMELNVYNGVLTEQAGREQKHWRDLGKVEQFLIEQAFEAGFGDLLERVGVVKSE